MGLDRMAHDVVVPAGGRRIASGSSSQRHVLALEIGKQERDGAGREIHPLIEAKASRFAPFLPVGWNGPCNASSKNAEDRLVICLRLHAAAPGIPRGD
jgi:hypothetical protein